MSFGTYRLSSEEQAAHHLRAARAARIRRLVEVREQDRHHASLRTRQYNEAGERAHSIVKEEMHREWEQERIHLKKLLMKQLSCERRCAGNAQTNAQWSNLIETERQKAQEHEDKRHGGLQVRRFRKAMQYLKKKESDKKFRMVQLALRRTEEKRNDRLLARKHARHIDRKPKTERSPNKDQVIAWHQNRPRKAIDFSSSRLHKTAAMSVHALSNHRAEEKNAIENANKERERIKSQALDQKQKTVWMNERARDRGEVAFLRERAIIQRQLHETHLQEEEKRENNEKQIQILQKAGKRVQSQPAARMNQAEEHVRQILHHFEDSKVSTSATNQSSTYPSRCARERTVHLNHRHESKSVNPQLNTTTIARSLLSPNTDCTMRNNVDASFPEVSTALVPQNQTVVPTLSVPVHVETQTKTHSPPNQQQASLQDKATSAEEPAISDRSGTSSQNLPNGSIQDMSMLCCTGAAEGIDVKSSGEEIIGRYSFACSPVVSGQLSSGEMDLSRCYEDSLSEALSMDTDIFMQQYLQLSPHSQIIENSSSLSDHTILDNLSTLLASTELSDDAKSSKSSISQESMAKKHEKMQIAKKTHSISSLVKELDKMSEDSLSLLSDLSDFLVSCTSQHDKGLQLSAASTTSTATTCSLRDQTSLSILTTYSLEDNSKSSDVDCSLYLETIPEEQQEKEMEIFSPTSILGSETELLLRDYLPLDGKKQRPYHRQEGENTEAEEDISSNDMLDLDSLSSY